MALFATLASLSHVAGGLTNAGPCRIMTGLWEPTYSSRQATYDLRRLRRKGFVERVEGTNTYRLTSHGRSIACFLTKVAARVVVPTLTELETTTRPRAPVPRPVVLAWRHYEREVESRVSAAGIPS